MGVRAGGWVGGQAGGLAGRRVGGTVGGWLRKGDRGKCITSRRASAGPHLQELGSTGRVQTARCSGADTRTHPRTHACMHARTQFQQQQQQQQFQAALMQQFQQQLQLQLGQVLQVGVTSHNAAMRLHNHNTHLTADPLLPLRKGRQPGTPKAAACGALPPAGLLPVTHGQALNASEAALHALQQLWCAAPAVATCVLPNRSSGLCLLLPESHPPAGDGACSVL
jgi:hypothetical protein